MFSRDYGSALVDIMAVRVSIHLQIVNLGIRIVSQIQMQRHTSFTANWIYTFGPETRNTVSYMTEVVPN